MRALGHIIYPQGQVMEVTESPIEALMLQALLRCERRFTLVKEGEATGEGFFIYPQYEFGPYRFDFLIHGVGYKNRNRVWPPNAETKVAIECDGKEFHRSPEQVERDQARDAYCRERGIAVLRYTGSEIYTHGDRLASYIAQFLDDRIWGQP